MSRKINLWKKRSVRDYLLMNLLFLLEIKKILLINKDKLEKNQGKLIIIWYLIYLVVLLTVINFDCIFLMFKNKQERTKSLFLKHKNY